MLKLVGIASLIIILSSCTFLQGSKSGNHNALCGQLKNRIVMNGTSANQRTAQIQRDDLHTLDKTYRDEGC